MSTARELTARELLAVAGSSSATGAALGAMSGAESTGGTDAGFVSNPTQNGFTWMGDGDDGGVGGYAVYYNSALNMWGWGEDDQGGGDS